MKFFGPNANGYRGDHFRGANEMLEAIPATPVDKQRAVEHYTAMAREAADGEAIERPITPVQLSFESNLGHAVLSGELDVSGALTALDDYETWVAAGQPKFGGTTTIAPSVQARIQ